jgi:hypothetical protein
VAQLTHVKRSVFERIGVSVDEQDNLFARRNGKPAFDLGLELALCCFVVRDDGRGP